MEKKISSLPLERKGYSDRTAAFLAELADLAYIQFELLEHDYETLRVLADAIKKDDETKDLSVLLADISSDFLSTYVTNEKKLRDSLADLDMELLRTFNADSTHAQAFIAKVKEGDDGHVLGEKVAVLSFRGSEKAIHDWATNFSIGDVKMICGDHSFQVHYGFLKAFKSLQKEIEAELKTLVKKGYSFYITGHSLGGAMAMIATHQLGRKGIAYDPDHPFNESSDFIEDSRLSGEKIAACYTFGSPRVAGIGFAQSIKSPLYRVVHADDPVPRVPPVLGPTLFLWLQSALFKWTPMTRNILPATFYVIAGAISKVVKTVLNKKKGISIEMTGNVIAISSVFVHHGDMRYIRRELVDKPLTVISNPDFLVRFKEFLLHSIKHPSKVIADHEMKKYIRLLDRYAEQRELK